MSESSYLGDGLYAEDQGFQFRLFTTEGFARDQVFLDNSTVDAFFRFIEKSRGVKITVTEVVERIEGEIG